MTSRRLALAVLGMAVAGSQAGHLVAYEIRFGSAAQQLQSTGAHAYFPLLAKTALGAVAAVFLAGIFVVGLARVLTHRSRPRIPAERSYLELLAALFTIQLAFFIAQEVSETMLAGVAVNSAPHLLLWGTLGQLPVAVIAAVALRWLLTRFESAIDDVRAVLAIARVPIAPAAVAVALWPVAHRALLLSYVAGGSLAKRGPPSSLHLSS